MRFSQFGSVKRGERRTKERKRLDKTEKRGKKKMVRKQIIKERGKHRIIEEKIEVLEDRNWIANTSKERNQSK